MTVYFLLYIEDREAGSGAEVDFFLEEAEARAAMKTAYAEAIQSLGFNTAIHREDHCCRCEESYAIIVDGEDYRS